MIIAICILTAVISWTILNRYYFVVENSSYSYTVCDKITGACEELEVKTEASDIETEAANFMRERRGQHPIGQEQEE